MADLAAYEAFLKRKIKMGKSIGFDCEPEEVNPIARYDQRDVVCWGVRRGRGAIFNSFGLGKTMDNLEIARLVLKKLGGGRALIGMPLNVRHEFHAEAARLGTVVKFIQTSAEAEGDGIYITNYESIREGKIDPRLFLLALFDEAGLLRSFGSKTFGEMLFGPMMNVPHRYVLTAVPDPNDFLELIAYAHFLGEMDMGEAKTRFFQRNSEHADELTLHPHKVEEFWMWVASWAIVMQRPSDLNPDYSDAGFDLPELEIRWHEVASDHSTAGAEKNGQGRLLKHVAVGATNTAAEKRSSLTERMAKLNELLAARPDDHVIIWHHLEDERRAIEKAIPGVVAVYGSKDLEERERDVIDFAEGRTKILAAKPSMYGSGCNLQKHCAWAVFLGIDFKFNDFIQAVHRLYRFLQLRKVTIDIVFTEAERGVKERLLEKWSGYNAQVARLRDIIREYGLSTEAMQSALTRSLGVERIEVIGRNWKSVRNDTVHEAHRMETASVHFIGTSPAFSTQYEYTAALEDFGHTDDDLHFMEQMDFVTPDHFRILKPGRVMAVHCKDRVVPGAMRGRGYMTISPFHCYLTLHYMKHGFDYMGKITVITDVVRENAQTYRLGWTEQCKDGSRMGVGLPEEILIFRKPPSDNGNGYADEPVEKQKWEYTRPRWQLDADEHWRSSGNRFLTPEDFVGLTEKVIWRLNKRFSLTRVYDHERQVRLGEALDAKKKLPPDFALIPNHSWHPDVWTDVFRARTLNGRQVSRRRVKHICPLQFDIVDRLIERYTMPGEIVYDPWGGIGTFMARSVLKDRIGRSCELNHGYFEDANYYGRDAELARSIPDLFALLDAEEGDGDMPAELLEATA